ncbi:MAG: tetratricopeptide repeat protein [Candidatus Latescibacterota bacterium]|nr:MAG: tetratricopeptide repeat protein [Candidatus Latescibacterota bacterium]
MTLNTHSPEIPAARRNQRFFSILLLGIAVVSVTLQIGSLVPLRNSFWGFHLYAFLPPIFAVASWVVLAVAAVLLGRAALREDAASAVAIFRAMPKRGLPRAISFVRHPVAVAALFAITCTLLFWAFRSQQTLLGDAVPLTTDLPGGQSFHPRQPMTMWVQQFLYQNTGDWFRYDGASDHEVARRVVALGSVLAGFFFVWVGLAVGRCLSNETSHKGAVRWLVTLTLLSQGYTLLFFGYVENYTFQTLVVGVYLLTAVLYLQKRFALQVATVVLIVGLGLHLSTLALLPSFLFLLGYGIYNRDRRVDALISGGVAVCGTLILDQALRRMSPGFSLWQGVEDLIGIAGTSQVGGAGLSYMFSWVHLRDFLNEQFLIGPLAAVLFVPGVLFAVVRKSLRNPIAVFLTLTAGSFLVGSFMMSEPLLGYARDWDLFAPAGVCYCAAGVYFLIRHVTTAVVAKKLLTFAVVFSVLQLIPWVWVNHSETRALERFKSLPLGYGRTEVVVGNWYLRHDDPETAKSWFRRALDAHPYNAAAYGFLGSIYAKEDRFDAAADMFEKAVTLRPDKPSFRMKYAAALYEIGEYQEALPHIRWLTEKEPDNYVYWQMLSEMLSVLGRSDELRDVRVIMLGIVERTLRISPKDEEANVNAGVLLEGLGRADEALARYQTALEVEPDSKAALFNSGRLLVIMGRRKEATPLLRKFLELYPDHPMAGWAREQVGD